jgi:tRNA pseudouridine38-40 synthase
MRNLRLLIAYDGTDFGGWQRQPGVPTIQGCLEDAIARVMGERVRLQGSGRTDAGVHAWGQVANFHTISPIPPENLARALNDTLPPAIRIRRVDEVRAEFHSRYHARSKTYRYRILLKPLCDPFVTRFVWHQPSRLDLKRMAKAASYLLGAHDFTSFCAAANARAPRPESKELDVPAAGRGSSDGRPKSEGRVRTIFASRLLWRPRTSMLIYEVKGSGFLRYMVRNIVGTLVEVGRGRLEPEAVARLLEARDRSRAGPTAPAQGLFLMNVDYGGN